MVIAIIRTSRSLTVFSGPIRITLTHPPRLITPPVVRTITDTSTDPINNNNDNNNNNSDNDDDDDDDDDDDNNINN